MPMQVFPDSFFARPGSAPIGGTKKGEFRDWTNHHPIGKFHESFFNILQSGNVSVRSVGSKVDDLKFLTAITGGPYKRRVSFYYIDTSVLPDNKPLVKLI